MTRSSMLFGLLSLFSVAAISTIPLACQGGGVGDPCTPEDEYDPLFAGYKVTLENIESRSFQCETRICLVNHFQGRFSCPLGQDGVKSCSNQGQPDSGLCDPGEDCVPTANIAQDCDPTAPDKGASVCGSPGRCNSQGNFCECIPGDPVPLDNVYFCDAETKQFKAYICHKKDNCQRPLTDDEASAGKESLNCDGNRPKDCCIPGTDVPVGVTVCGQCAADDGTKRDANNAVYCSCRCGVAEGSPEDPDFNFCDCPTGFTCSEIRPDVGLGDKQITGKYCIKTGTEYNDQTAANCRTRGVLPIDNDCQGAQERFACAGN
jgi:hypothetical protein